MSAVELKPCPATCIHTIDRGEPYVGARRSDVNFVRCATCGCCTEYFPTADEAIAAWNTRPTAALDEAGVYPIEAKAIADKVVADARAFGFGAAILHTGAMEAAKLMLAARAQQPAAEVEKLLTRIENLRDSLEHCGKLISDGPEATLGFVRRAAFRAIEEDDTAIRSQVQP